MNNEYRIMNDEISRQYAVGNKQWANKTKVKRQKIKGIENEKL